MRTISPFRFGVWVMSIFAGVYLILSGHTAGASVLLGLSGLLLISRAGAKEPVRSRDAVVMMILLVVVLALVIGAGRLFSETALNSIQTHPALVIPIWLGLVLFVYRRWRYDRSRSAVTNNCV